MSEISLRVCPRRVVGEEELASLTLRGWRVVESYEVDAPIAYEESREAPITGSYDYRQPVRKVQIGRVRRFVLEQDEANALAMLGREVDLANARALDLEERVRAKTSDASDAEKKIGKLEIELSDARKSRDGALVDLDRIKARSRIMEADLGKLRSELGAERFRKITGDSNG